jgi:hypothetical protein
MESSELDELQKVEERLADEVGALLLINKGGQEAANVSTWKAGPKLSPAEPLLVRPRHRASIRAQLHGSFENCFLLSPNGQLANFTSARLIAAHNSGPTAGSCLYIGIAALREAYLRLA